MLFFGSCPGCQGRNAGTFGLFGLGGISQLILDSKGPLPLSSFGSEEAGMAFSLSRASNVAGGFIDLCISLERGTSSLFLIGDLPGNFIGEIGFLYFLDLLFIGVAGGPHFLVPDGPGFGSFSIWLVGPDFGLPLRSSTGGPGFGVLIEVSDSENLTFVSSSSEGSTSPSSFESLELEVSLSSSTNTFFLAWNCNLLFSLLISCLLSSIPVSRNFSRLIMVCSR